MGLDAEVRCRCWEDGLTADPPVPRERVKVGEGNELWLSDMQHNEYLTFRQWKQDACPHPDMEFASAHIGTWHGYGRFRNALWEAGRELFPVLEAELPTANGGLMAPEQAARALEELELFKIADLGESTKLVDEADDRVLDYWSGGTGMFFGANPWRIGFDPAGLFVRNVAEDPEREEFRATRLAQEALGDQLRKWRHEPAVRLSEEWLARPKPLWVIRLTNLDNSAQLTLALDEPIGAMRTQQPDGRWLWDGTGHYPQRLSVVTEAATAEEYAYVLEGLTTVFRAAVEVGQPVQWM